MTKSYYIFSIGLGSIISLLFIGLGLGMLTNLIQINPEDNTLYRIFGFVVLIYGIFRLIRVYWKYQEMKDGNQ